MIDEEALREISKKLPENAEIHIFFNRGGNQKYAGVYKCDGPTLHECNTLCLEPGSNRYGNEMEALNAMVDHYNQIWANELLDLLMKRKYLRNELSTL